MTGFRGGSRTDGKGRNTDVVWLGGADSLVSCCIFEAANHHLLVVSHCRFLLSWPLQMVV